MAYHHAFHHFSTQENLLVSNSEVTTQARALKNSLLARFLFSSNPCKKKRQDRETEDGVSPVLAAEFFNSHATREIHGQSD